MCLLLFFLTEKPLWITKVEPFILMDLRRFSIYLNYFKIQLTLKSTQAKAPPFLQLNMQTPSLLPSQTRKQPVTLFPQNFA